MSVKSAPYFWVECDRCGAPADYGDFAAMSDESQAVDIAVENEWLAISGRGGEKHYCYRCTVWSDEEDQLVPNFEPFEGGSR